MPARRSWLVASVMVLAVILGSLVGLEFMLRRSVANPPGSKATLQQRQALFDLLQPVALSNCRLERVGEDHDGGYLMCGNLLEEVQVGYSYGISGYDKWGCDISTKRGVTVHQYRLFRRQAACVSWGPDGFSPGMRRGCQQDRRRAPVRHDRESVCEERR